MTSQAVPVRHGVPRSRTGLPTICLCMIVKNEAAVIERCLASVRPLIDTWVISDTGSTDGTQDLIRADLVWHYVCATHEYLDSPHPHRTEHLDALVVNHHADGGSRADKFDRDARLLRADLARDPDNPRTVFYLAQTMRDLGRNHRSHRAVRPASQHGRLGGRGLLLPAANRCPQSRNRGLARWPGRPHHGIGRRGRNDWKPSTRWSAGCD